MFMRDLLAVLIIAVTCGAVAFVGVASASFASSYLRDFMGSWLAHGWRLRDLLQVDYSVGRSRFFCRSPADSRLWRGRMF
jgi:hypothetical protein